VYGRVNGRDNGRDDHDMPAYYVEYSSVVAYDDIEELCHSVAGVMQILMAIHSEVCQCPSMGGISSSTSSGASCCSHPLKSQNFLFIHTLTLGERCNDSNV